MECNECKNEQRIVSLEKDSARNQVTHKEFFTKFENINTAQAVSDERYNTILKELGKVSCNIEEMKAKPGKKWENAWDKVLMVVLTVVVMFLMAKLGM